MNRRDQGSRTRMFLGVTFTNGVSGGGQDI